MNLKVREFIKIFCVCTILLFGSLSVIPFGTETACAGTFNQTSSSAFSSGETIFTDISTNPGSIQLMQEPDLAWTSVGNDTTSANFGRSVASAGDVNGDGYDDVIVGANRDLGSALTRPGRAYLYLGSAQGLEKKASWIAYGNDEANSYFGWSVAGAGDVNGDGYDDVIVGAHQEDVSAYTDCGAAFIYLGCPSGLMDSYWGYLFPTIQNAQFGQCVAGAGDVNNDGFDDFLVGAQLIDTSPYTDNGRAWLYLGASSFTSISMGWSHTAAQNYSYYGCSLTGVGDVNSDGYDDWLVGARGMDSGSTNSAGVAYLYLGSSTPFSTTSSWSSSGDLQAYSEFGISVSCAGDVNADGYNDWLVGQSSYATTISDIVGKAYLYLGSSSVGSTDYSWSSIGENKTYSKYGYRVSGVGDLNGDGYDDWVVGCPDYTSINSNCGKIYLYAGSNFGFSTTAVWTSIGDNQESAHFGFSASGAGDVNGDGTSDFVIGAYGYDENSISAGKVYLYMNHETVAQTVPVWESVGEAHNNTKFGTSVACAGDINGDGFDDWLVGAPGDIFYGEAFLYLGSASGLSKTPAWNATGAFEGSWVGYGGTVAGAGDVNGDGYDDWLVGSPFDHYINPPDIREECGKVFLYLGRASSINTISASWTGFGENDFSYFGYSIDGLGDVNNDGYDDWIIGEPGYDKGTLDFAGRFCVYLGSPSVTGTDPTWTGSGDDQEGAEFGTSVAGVGDVNGDMYDDWIVSGPGFNSSSSASCGAVYLYYGAPAGTIFSYAQWISYGDDQTNASFGRSLAGAGDVNGDGYKDIIIGTDRYDTLNHEAGKVYLYLGSSSGLATSPAWTSSGKDQKFGYYGYSLASSGDVNGDGYSDWLVGSLPNTPTNFVGKAYLYLGGSILNTKPVWTSQGEFQADSLYSTSVSGSGDINGDGYDEWLVGAQSYSTSSNRSVGKVYIYRARGYCEYGEFVSSVCDGEYYQPDVWQSLEWLPKQQDEDLEVKFQVAMNDDGTTWDFIGPDGTSNTYFTGPAGEEIYPDQFGRYLRYKAYFQVNDNEDQKVTKTPVIDEVTIHYGAYEKPAVTVLSPNGGEDWMKSAHYPITWRATGTLGDNPVTILYTLDNGDNWTVIASNEPNDGIYNWTVPNQETPNAFIRIEIMDIYSNQVSDTSDASFAIDPPWGEVIEPYAPAIDHIPPQEGNSDQPFTIIAKVKNLLNLKSVIIYYRFSDEDEYRSKKMTSTDAETFYANLDLDKNGDFEYYIKASNGLNSVESDLYKLDIETQSGEYEPDGSDQADSQASFDNGLVAILVIFGVILLISIVFNVFLFTRHKTKKKNENTGKKVKSNLDKKKIRSRSQNSNVKLKIAKKGVEK